MKIKKFKITENNFSRTVDLPIYTGEDASIEMFLDFVDQFQNNLVDLKADNDGDRMHSCFKQALKGTALTEWSEVVANHRGRAMTEAAFEARLDRWIMNKMSDANALADQKTYMRALTKPRKMSVATFVQRMQRINSLLTRFPQFPGQPNVTNFSAEDIKQIIFDAMPPTWANNFLSANNVIHDMTINEIQQYFSQQERIAENT